MTRHTLRITWPIEDPDEPLMWLKAQAREDLDYTIAAHGMNRVTGISWHITHGEHPQLSGTCEVLAEKDVAATA